MANIKLEKLDNHLKIVINTESYNDNLKKDIKNIKSVRVFNAIKLTDKIRLSIFPFNNSDLEKLAREVTSRLAHL